MPKSFALAASLILALILVGAGCTSRTPPKSVVSEAPQTGGSAVAQKNSLFDESTWTVAETMEGDFDGDSRDEKAYLLKTISSVDEGGAGGAEYGVRLLIVGADGQKRFEYTPSEVKKKPDDYFPLGYFRAGTGSEKTFYSEDLTGDNVPEVIFSAGISGASDYTNCTNIVTYNRNDKQFALVNEGDFCSTFNTGINISNLGGAITGSQVLKAIPSNGMVDGNKREQPFDITVYTWDGHGFWPYKKFRSLRSYEGGANAVSGEMYQIQKRFWEPPSPPVEILR